MIEVFVIMGLWLQPRVVEPGVFFSTKESCVSRLDVLSEKNRFIERDMHMYACVPVYKIKEAK